MAKRSRDALTGGSKDVNPQEFVITGTQTAADAPTVIQQPLPIPRLPTKEGYNLVIEVLWVQFYHLNAQIPQNGIQTIGLSLTTNPQAPVNVASQMSDIRALSAWFKQTGILVGGQQVGMNLDVMYEDDLTDQAGHGILLATDNVYFVITSVNTAALNNAICRFGYRFKEVKLVEYIGIVQSQQ